MIALVLQSFHSFHHLEQLLTEKHCQHDYKINKTEINHQHHDLDHCFVCEFAFSNLFLSNKLTFTSQKVQVVTKYSSSYSKEITQFFKGSLFALRAPPLV